MRTIKFRGKAGNGKWIYGDIVHFEFAGTRSMAIMPENEDCDRVLNYKVDPDTVGQYTGLADKDGKEIYEGDIVETFIGNLEIIWSQGLACYRLQDGGGGLYSIDGMEMEVVGDIHDNPELLTE